MARLDDYLRNTGLVRQRSEAKRACDAGRVWVDGQPAKASRPVRQGEVIRIDLPDRLVEAEVLAVPERPPARADRGRYCRILRRETRDPHADLTF
ncbi:MAG: S4 domain-containing protein [Candidatus Latescibacterota bacterium]